MLTRCGTAAMLAAMPKRPRPAPAFPVPARPVPACPVPACLAPAFLAAACAAALPAPCAAAAAPTAASRTTAAPATAAPQQPAPCEDCYGAQEAREDLQTLYDNLQQEHVDLFARRDRTAYDAKLAELLARVDGPVPRPEFHLMLHEAMAFGDIAHAKTEAAILDALAHVRSGGTIIPLSVRYSDGAMLTDEWAAPGDALPPGSRITRIGNMTVAEFEDRAREIISADTDRLLRSQMEAALPVFLYLVLGPRDALTLGHVAPDGTAGTTSVPALSLADMKALQQARPVAKPGRDPLQRVARDLGNGIHYLQPGPFFASEDERGDTEDDYAIAAFRQFVKGAFADIAASGATDLLIDLRGNPGGDVSFSDLVVARLTDRPYRFASRYEVRAGPNTKASWADWQGDPDSLGGRVAAAIASAEPGERVEIDLPVTRPIADHAFRGKVWVLIDRHSFSNAAVVAALMQDLGIATVLGEETADLPTTYGAVESFDLPRSGATITYPKAYMVRPSGSEAVRGVVPDIAIAPNPVGESRDLMLDRAAAHILRSR